MVGLSTEEDGQNNKSVSSKMDRGRWSKQCRQRKMVKTINLYPQNNRGRWSWTEEDGQGRAVDRGRWSKQ